MSSLSPVVINWKATLQSIIILSTTKIEYMIAIEVMKKTIWLRGLVDDLGLSQDITPIYCDGQSAIHLTKN